MVFKTINQEFIQDNIQDTKEHSWKFIFLTYILYGVLLVFIVFFIYQYQLLNFIQIQTNHIIHLTLLMSLLIFFLIVWLLIMKLRKMTARELGLKKQQLKEGILFYMAIYALVNIVLLVLNLILTSSPNFAPYWSERGLVYSIGALIAQVFGNVLVEEVYFRGYLLNQLTIKFYKKNPSIKDAEFKSIFKGVVVSSVMFALLHIPIRIFNGILGMNLLINLLTLIGMGALFALIYVFSNNLFFAMAVHILTNISFALFAPIVEPSYLTIGFTFLLIFCLIGVRKYRMRKYSNIS